MEKGRRIECWSRRSQYTVPYVRISETVGFVIEFYVRIGAGMLGRHRVGDLCLPKPLLLYQETEA